MEVNAYCDHSRSTTFQAIIPLKRSSLLVRFSLFMVFDVCEVIKEMCDLCLNKTDVECAEEAFRGKYRVLLSSHHSLREL